METMKWHERMNALMRDKGWTLAELARRSGVDYDSIAKYAQGEVSSPRGKRLAKIAEALGVTEQALFFGIAAAQKLTDYDRLSAENVKGTHKIPRITLSELANHKAGHDVISVWPGEMSMIVDDQISISCMAVSVEDNSMLPAFKPGDVLICDPNADIEPGDFVIAKANGHHKALIRKYRLAKSTRLGMPVVELVPLNADYPTEVINKEHPGHVIARCMFAVTKL